MNVLETGLKLASSGFRSHLFMGLGGSLNWPWPIRRSMSSSFQTSRIKDRRPVMMMMQKVRRCPHASDVAAAVLPLPGVYIKCCFDVESYVIHRCEP